MGKIYQRAHPVIIWLGGDQEEAALKAFEVATQIHDIARKIGMGSLEPARSVENSQAESAPSKYVQANAAKIKRAMEKIDIESLLSLLSRKWFTHV
ncbi:hypothetical protein G7Y89_g4167 [Cudoniella acicularis]|uniref:Uncharacterized protein n=1 Tax=Cudoniella acicularis TaxID=354080 RepID=A0A8H4RPZ2_9HELO|nr:hypothetical protein G7Y89_g4167 [Cudoniella acicularis]